MPETAEDLLGLLTDLDGRAEDRSVEAREILRAWIASLLPTYGALEPGDDAARAEVGTWVSVARQVASKLPVDAAIELLEQVHPIANRSADLDRRAAIGYDLARHLLDVGRLDEAASVLATGRAALDGRWVYRPLLDHQRIRLARLSGRYSDGLEAAAELLASEHFFHGAIDAMPAPDPAQVEIADLHRRTEGLVFGERARMELELGRLDRAAAASMSEIELGERADDATLLIDGHLALAAGRFLGDDPEGTLREADFIVDELGVDPSTPTVRFLRGMALGSLALRGDANSPSNGAEPELLGALALPGLDQLAAFDAEWMLAELALAADDSERALRWTDAGRTRFESWGQSPDALGTRELRLIANEAELACRTDADREALGVALEALERGLAKLLEGWAEIDLEAGGAGFLESEERRGLFGELVRVRERLDGEAGLEAAVGDLLRAQAMGSVARRRALAPGSLAEVRSELLGPGRGLLIWVATAPTTHLLVVDTDRVRSIELPGLDRLREPVGALERALRASSASAMRGERRDLDELDATSRRAGELLLPESLRAELLDWNEALMVGVEVVRGLEPAALAWSDEALLGEHLALTHLPSIPLALDAERVRRSSERSVDFDLTVLAHLAPSDAVDERFGALSEVDPSAIDVSRSTRPYAGGRARSVVDPAPTADDLWRALDDSAVVQVLAHGVLDPFRERGSGIVLAPGIDGRELLWPEDVEAQAFRARALTLLTSCGTAVGPRRTGDDEPTSIAASLLERGASGVYTTSAKLELGLAEDLAGALHRALASGASAAEALRRARAELGRRDRARAYDLARIRLLGSPAGPFEDRPIRSRTSRTAVTALTLAAMLLIGLGIARRARRRAGRSLESDQSPGGTQ